MFRVFSMAVLFLVCEACGTDVSFSPPPQRPPVRHAVKAVLEMGAGRERPSWASIVQDVQPLVPGLAWRWTGAHPTFRFTLADYEGWSGWKAVARVTTADKVLATMGAQHITVSVNGARVGIATLDQARTYDLSFAVGAAILSSASPVTLRMDIDPCLPSRSASEKGLLFGVLLHSIGFVREAQ